MQTDREPQPGRDMRPFLIAGLIIVLVVAMIVLHVTGVVGPG